MIRVGRLLGMFFDKDPEQHECNVVIKGMYFDKVWVMYEESGKDEILDIADVRFKNPTRKEYTPEHSFIALDAENNWLFWDHEKGYWYGCSDPTDLQTEDSQNPLFNGESQSGQTLH